MSRIKVVKQNVDETWFAESRSFFEDVIKDTISNLRGNSTSAEEREMLAKLSEKWKENYKASERMPEHSPEMYAAPLPNRKPRSRATAKATVTNAKSTPGPNEVYVDANTLDDQEEIVYRINIPPLRPHWECRSFDLKVKAQVCKKNLVQPLINWRLLDNIMTVPMEEGTVTFQKYIDDMLLPQQL